MELHPRLAALVVKSGLSLSLLGADERALLLSLAASSFQGGRTYREAEVNDVLSAWLNETGSMLRIDHVELRRWLVDMQFIARDGYGRAYVRGDNEALRAKALLGSDDAAALARSVGAIRAATQQRRDARRREFEER